MNPLFRTRRRRIRRSHCAALARKGLARVCLLGVLAVQSASCGPVQPRPEAPLPEFVIRQIPVAEDSAGDPGFRHGLVLLGEGKWAEAREILQGLMESPEPCEICPKTYFFLGLLDLLQMEDLSQMEKYRDYMRAYPKRYPQGPFLKNAERIARFLDQQIDRHQKDQQRARALNQKIEEQAKEIETLKYQIQTLEEIHLEAEKAKEVLDQQKKGTGSLPDLNRIQ